MSLELSLTPFGLGSSHLASLGKSLTTNEARRLFDTALYNNVRVIDTADTYGSGDSERIIGHSIADKRKEFFLITKAGFPHLHTPSYLSPLNQIGKKVLQLTKAKKKFSKEYLVQALYKSLKRLRMDHVNAFLLHEPFNTELLQHPDYWEALLHIRKSGMAQYIGISTEDVDALDNVCSNIKLDLVQTAVPYFQDKPNNILVKCKENGIPVVLNQVLSISNKVLLNNDIENKFRTAGKSEKDIIPVLISYAQCYLQGDCILVGTRNPRHLESNVTINVDRRQLESIFETIARTKFSLV